MLAHFELALSDLALSDLALSELALSDLAQSELVQTRLGLPLLVPARLTRLPGHDGTRRDQARPVSYDSSVLVTSLALHFSSIWP